MPAQAIEHIGYIRQGYELFTFNMVHAPHPDNPAIAVIKNFERRLAREKRERYGMPIFLRIPSRMNSLWPAIISKVRKNNYCQCL